MQISPIYLNTHAPFVPYCWNFEKIGLNSKVFGVELKTYDPSSPLSSPQCCLFPALRQQSFIRGKGLSSISGGTGGDFLWMNSKCFSLLIYINYTFLVTSCVINVANQWSVGCMDSRYVAESHSMKTRSPPSLLLPRINRDPGNCSRERFVPI